MYIDLTYYNEEFYGEEVEQTEFNKLEMRASEVIDQLTHYRVTDLSNLTSFQQEQVKKAVAAQVEFYVVNDGVNVESGEDFSNYAIGSFSFSKGGKTESKQAARVSPSAIAYLNPTGLLYAGVSSC